MFLGFYTSRVVELSEEWQETGAQTRLLLSTYSSLVATARIVTQLYFGVEEGKVGSLFQQE